MTRKNWTLIAGAGFVMLYAGLGHAQTSAKAPPRALSKLLECRTINDPKARLACFDEQVAAIDTAASNDDVVVLDREDIRKTRRSLFGFSMPRLPFLKDDKNDESSADVPATIEATIARARGLGYGKWAFQLDDGAQWETTEAIPSREPRAGMPIIIKRAAIGSFLGKVNGWQAVRMKRVG